MRTLKGAVAVVTGAGSGIGRALALALAERGSALALADVNESALAETRDAIAGKVKVTTRRVDVSDKAAMTDFRDAVKSDFGRVSLLVNNAGVALFGRFAELSLDDLEWIMGINFWGAVYGCKLFLPLLLEEPAANIVTISSVFGIIGPPRQSGYAASKFAVRGFSEALRHELATTNVRVTVVHPGGIATNIAKAQRVGAQANPAESAVSVEDSKRALVMPPADAAAQIVAAILHDRPRLLIGRDAKLLDAIQRIWPARYLRVLGPLLDPEKKYRN